MRNFRKRILSFASAVAMVVTLTPKFTTIASGTTDTLRVEAENYRASSNNSCQTKGSDTYYGAYSGDTWMEMTGECELYVPIQIPDTSATYTVKVRYTNNGGGKNTWVNLWDPSSSGESITVGGNTYYKRSTAELGSTGKAFTTATPFSNVSFSSTGTYYVGLYGKQYAAYDYVEVVASKNVYGETPTTYTISATAGTGGTASMSETSPVASGTSVTFTATPDSGYSFVKWVDANNESTTVSTNATYTTTITANTALKAIFEQQSIPSVTYPQELYAIENSAKNSKLHYIVGSDSNTRVDGDFLNSTGSAQVSVALPFVIDDISADVTYTVEVYAQGQGNPYAIVWDSSDGEVEAKELTPSNWGALKSTPTTFTFAGSDFPARGTYYAGIKANEYINFYKIEVTKSAPIGDKAEAVGPYKSGSVSLDGTTLTATPTNSRDYKFVGWYSDEGCTNKLSDSTTYTYADAKVYAKFDYVAFNMPIIDIVTHDKNGDPHASFNDAWAGKSKDTRYKNSDITITNTNYTLAETKVEIKGRGNSTWSLDKKPFQLKFVAPVNLFNKGTAASKTWILLANHADRSLLRNQLALDFARSALNGIPFSSSTTPVEVYINGEYQGVYLVVEKSEVDTGRVNITTVSENTSNIDEIGFLAEWDKLAEDNNHVPQEDYYVKVEGNGMSQFFTLKDGVPEGETLEGQSRPSDATAAGGSNSNITAIAISTYLNDVSNTIMTGTQEQVAAKVDMNSLVDMFILQELTKNCDVGGSSFYVSKNAGAGSKLTFQPPWDFDRGFGNDQRGTNAGKLYINGSDDGDNANQNQWFQHLYKETNWFKPLVVARWNALRNNAATDPRTMLANTVDSFASDYAASANRNFDKWQVLSASTGIYGEVSAPGSYSGAISGLQSWITDRLDYLDIEWQYEDSSIQTLTVNYDATDYSYETGEFDYNDGGTKNAKVIPFVVNDTTHDITIKMNFTGSSKWVNVFTPSGASLTGFQDSESNSRFDGVGTKYYVKTDGSFTFKIPAGSPTGTYYAAVTNPESYTSVTAKFTDDQAVTPYGSAAGEFSVSATSSDQAMGSASVNKSTADSGETATFTATANSGYMFVNWTDNNSGEVVSTANPYSATVTGNMSLQANFQAIPNTTVEVEANNNAYGYVINYANNETVTSVSLSSNVTLKAKNRDGYLFVNWTVMEEDGSNKQSLGTRSKIKISDIASTLGGYESPILMANFGAKTAVRFEAENFTDFISETKYQGQSLRDYDDPTAVLQGNTGYTAVSGSTTDPYKYNTTNNNTFGDGHKAGTASGSSTTIAGGQNYYIGEHTFSGLDLSGYESVKVTVGTKFGEGYEYYKVSVKNNSTGVTTEVTHGDTSSTVEVDISNYRYSNCDVIVYVNGERWIDVKGTEAASAGLGKIENWDNKSYSDLNVASTYSNGAAAALTGPSNGLAIPFTINEDLDDDLEVELGYNYGTLSEAYTNGSSTWYTGGLFVNLYTYADYNTVKSLMLAQDGWSQSGNATPSAASDFLKSQGTLTGNAFYYKLSVGTRDEVQTTTITLPAGLPAGNYMLSVATDENNYYYDEKYGNDYVDSVGTAFYDYIQFYTASTPDQPSPLTVGANFIFTDKWGNDLMTNAISKSTYSEGNILFNPSAPRYLVAQGYNIIGWTISEYDNDVGDFVPMDAYPFTYNGVDYTTDANGYVQLNENSEYAYDQETQRSSIDLGCDFIGSAAFPSGSTIKFKAEYAVAVDSKTVTITNGKIYRKSSSGDTQFRSLLADGTKIAKSTQIPNFGEIRLEPSFEQDAEFSYWTLNGMLYSFDADIHFSAWTNADFTACMANGTETRAVAFIDTTARTSGFETDDTSYHKITYDCAFYVPSGSTYVSAGLVYSNDKAAVKAATVSVSDSGAVSATTTTGKVLTTTVKSNLLLGGPDSNILNRQVMISISGMKKSQSAAASGKSIYRSAMAYLIYRDGSGYHVVTSPNVVTAEAAVNPNSSSEDR